MYERMLNKNEKPTAKQMASYCGATSTMSNGDSMVQAIIFPYGNNYGWGISHKGKGKLICNVFSESGAFTVMIRLSDKQFSSVYEKLDEYAKEYIDNNQVLYENFGLGKVDLSGGRTAINLYGPPGTGKSVTAEAIANICIVPSRYNLAYSNGLSIARAFNAHSVLVVVINLSSVNS